MKSQFEHFIKEATKKPLAVETCQSSNEYLNSQTQALVMKTIANQKIAKGFIKMGIMAAMVALPILSMAHGNHSVDNHSGNHFVNHSIETTSSSMVNSAVNGTINGTVNTTTNHYEQNLSNKTSVNVTGTVKSEAAESARLATKKYQAEMEETLEYAKTKGYLTVSPQVHTKEIQYTGTRYDAIIPGVENHLDALTQSKCDISITFSKQGHTVFMAYDNDLKKITDPENAAQEKIARQFLLLHEASHCEMNSMQDVFLIKGNPQLQKDVNHYFKNMTGSDNNDSAYWLIQENFADTYAAMQLIKENNASPDVLKVINNFTLERHDLDLSTTKQRVDSHYTHISMSKVLTPESLERIKSSNPEQLKQFALEVANHGVNTVLSTYKENLPEMFDSMAMAKSAFHNFQHQSQIQFFSKIGLMADNTPHSVNNEGYFRQIGNYIMDNAHIIRQPDAKYRIKDLNEEQMEVAFNVGKNKFIADYHADYEKIDKTVASYIKYVKSFEPSQKTTVKTSYYELVEMKKEMITSYQLRQKSFDNSLDNNTVNKLDFNPSHIIKNIFGMRVDTENQNSLKPS